ncbi:hypothetical protein [Halalkalibaculum sp. DA3122]|uniref:DUF7133 domain-containing protein n=1 Tax=Halalkalibaculum sp. DA3122 TaxID=3373607 RepID=UPI003753F92E
MKYSALILIFLFGAVGLYQPQKKFDSLDRDKESRKLTLEDKFDLPEGFSIRKIAEGPDVINPMRMTVDEEGNIYVSEAHNYRYGGASVPEGQKKEKFTMANVTNPIKRIEFDSEGQVERIKVVAEGFDNPVMGISVHNDKFYAASLNELFVMDIGPKGQLLDRKLLVKDAAVPWNPFGMYGVIVGPDDKLWLSVADHPESELTGTDGSTVRFSGQSGGLVRCDLDGSNLELITDGLRAPYIFDIDPWGHIWLISNGEQSPNIYLDVIPGMDYGYRSRDVTYNWLAGRTPLAPPVMDMGPGANTTAYHYYSSMFPSDYWGDVFVSNWGSHGFNPTNRVVRRFSRKEKENSGGFIEHDTPFLSTLSDSMFRPTSIVPAPDGGLYLSDWHGRDDYNNNMGYIYKITYQGDGEQEKVPISGDIEEMSPNKLVELLGHPNHFIREQVQGELLKHDTSALTALSEVAENGDAFASATAIWTLTRMNSKPASQTMISALNHAAPRVRAHALRQLRQAAGQQLGEGSFSNDRPQLISVKKLGSIAQSMLDDPNGEVRIEAALALKSKEDVGRGLLRALEVATSDRLRYQIGFELGRRGDKATLEKLYASSDPEKKRIAYIAAMTARYEESSLASVVKDWDLPLSNKEKAERLVEQIKAGNKIQLANEKVMALKWLENNPPKQKELLDFLLASLQDPNQKVQSASLRVVRIASIDSDEIREATLRILNNTQSEFQQMNALYTLGSFSESGSPEIWQSWITHSSNNIAISALRALRQRDHSPSFVNELWNTIHDTKGNDPVVIEEVYFTFKELGIPEKQLAELPVQLDRPEDKQQFGKEVLSGLKNASAKRGKIIFSTSKAACTSCHATSTGNVTSNLGPNLADIGAASQPQYLIESILEPNKVIKTGYQIETIETKSGKVVTGQVEKKSDKLIVRQFGMEPVEISLSEVNKRTKSPISIMPSGLEKEMTVTELADLTKYLRSLDGSN